MATNYGPEIDSSISSVDTLCDEDFLDITLHGDEIQYSLASSISVESVRTRVNENSQPWEFVPTEYVPSTHSLSENAAPSKVAKFPNSNFGTLSNLIPSQRDLFKFRKQLSLPHIGKRKRSTPNPNTSFNSYDIIDPYEPPSTEALEQEWTQSLIQECVLVDHCLVDGEDEQKYKSAQLSKHFPSKKRVEQFMARIDSRWQAAVNYLKLSVEEDQEMHGVWLLSEIDHWDNECERVVMLLDDSILIAKYNFHLKVLREVRSIGFSGIYAVSYGPFQSPSRIFKKRPGIGIRLHWNKDAPLSKAQKLNPWSEKIPFTTLGPHPSTYNTVQSTTEEHHNTYSFFQRLKECLKTYSVENDSDVVFNGVDTLLPHSSKFGILQQIHNRAKLGCDRAKLPSK